MKMARTLSSFVVVSKIPIEPTTQGYFTGSGAIVSQLNNPEEYR